MKTALIPAQSFLMGLDDGRNDERPVHRVWIDAFAIGVTQVTNREFAAFVQATGHPLPPVSFSHPERPVVAVSWFDAVAFCDWRSVIEGRRVRLPSEAEWECAARGGLDGAVFAWGDDFDPDGQMMANTWQGEFPWQNLMTDGYAGTSPVGTFPPNGYGLHDVTGNVWEWTCSEAATHTADSPCCAPTQAGEHIPRRVIKGGSHLCAPNYCLRYRPAARQFEAVDTSTTHIGFRCIVRPDEA